jgi:hypothetical protein
MFEAEHEGALKAVKNTKIQNFSYNFGEKRIYISSHRFPIGPVRLQDLIILGHTSVPR